MVTAHWQAVGEPLTRHRWLSLRNAKGSLKMGFIRFQAAYLFSLGAFVGKDEAGAYAVGLVLQHEFAAVQSHDFGDKVES